KRSGARGSCSRPRAGAKAEPTASRPACPGWHTFISVRFPRRDPALRFGRVEEGREGTMPPVPTPSIFDPRRDQMYPTLAPSEIERVRRFGKMRTFAPGEPLAEVGVGGVGLAVILSGAVDVSRHDSSGERTPLVTHQPGAFLGELAQLAGRPALVDATARGAVEALVIPPDQLRALLIAEAELGERIMRALIL